MKESLLTVEKKSEIASLARKYGITLFVLFGSQATGRTHAQSDADFAFVSKHALSPHEIAHYAFDLSAVAHFSHIELTDIHDAPPLLLKQVAVTGILLYEAEPSVYALFRIYAIKRYMEAQKLLSLRVASLNAFLQHAHHP